MFDAGFIQGSVGGGTNNPMWEGGVTSVLLGDGIGMGSQGRAPSWQRKGPEVWRHRHRLERSARARLWNSDHRSVFERDLPSDYRGQSGVRGVKSQVKQKMRDLLSGTTNCSHRSLLLCLPLPLNLPPPCPWSSFLKITPRGGKSL